MIRTRRIQSYHFLRYARITTIFTVMLFYISLRRPVSAFFVHRSTERRISRSTEATTSAQDQFRLLASVAPPASAPSGQSNKNKNALDPRRQGKKPKQMKRRNSNKYEIRQMFKRAKDLERRGQWKKSAELLNQILERDPADAYSHLALAKLEARRFPDEKERACSAFQRGFEACPKSVHILQAWAVHEEASGHNDRARELFEECLALDPHNAYACHAYGLMERRQGDLVKAQALWSRALEKDSTAALVCQMGELMIEAKDLKKARALYEENIPRLKSAREKTEVHLAWAWLEERYLGDPERAEELIVAALQLNPSSSKAQVALARLEGRRQQRTQGGSFKRATARRLASACIGSETREDLKCEDGRLYNAWANLEAKSNQLSSAIKILRRGLAVYPKDHSLWQAAGKLEERRGNYTGARTLFGESLRIQPSAPTLVAYAMLDLKHPLSGTVDFEKCCQLFEEAILLEPRHGPTYNSYGKALLRSGDVERAKAVFEKGIKAKCSDVASVFHGYAQLELSMGNIGNARSLLCSGIREAQRLDVGTDSPHRERAVFLTHTLGMIELNSNQPIDALNIFLDGMQRYGKSSQLLLGAALCEVKRGDDDRARAFFEQSVRLDDKHAQAWQAWGVMELRAGNGKVAETLFECGLKTSPKHGALWVAFAVAEGRAGKVEKARSLFATGIKNAPQHVPLYQAWASFELREENFESAKTLIAEALTRDKRNGSGWLVAAEIERGLGNKGLVGLILRRGIECAPHYAQLYRSLGDLLQQDGKVNEARSIYEKGLEVDPLHAPLYHALAELEASVFNVNALSDLNKKAAWVFSPDASARGNKAVEDAWGKKIKASRSRGVPKGIKALANRIVDDDAPSLNAVSDPSSVVDTIGTKLMEDGLVGQLLTVDDIESDEEKSKPPVT